MWEGNYLTRTSESRFSWSAVKGFIEQLIERGEFSENLQASLFSSMVEQQSLIEQAEAEKSSAFSVSQADLDNELVRGTGFKNGKYRVYQFYQILHTQQDALAFLKKEYGIGGHSHTFLDGSSGFVDHDAKGIRFRVRGNDGEQNFSWRAIDSRLKELIALDRYLTEKEKAYLPTYEQEQAERRLQQAEEAAAREALKAAVAAMDETRKSAEYRFSLGDEVQLGAQTYTVLGYDDKNVTLSNPKYPLLSEDMPRDVFERRLRESEVNDRLIVQNEVDLTEAKRLIDEYCLDEFESEADYADLEHVALAFTTTGDGEHTVEAQADLVHFSINRYVDGQLFESRSYDSIEELISNELQALDFNDLTYLDQQEAVVSYPVEEEVQVRYRTETRTDSEGNPYTVEVPYNYYILHVDLENFNLSHVPVYIMGEEQLSMYAMYMSSLGNRPDLFPQSGYVSKYYENPPADYEVPAALLGSDEKFARLMEEADKYVGFPYVWGGSTPETSFDCSGFVSYVLTNSGLYNTGRLGAQGLYNISTPVSNPQPGDLVFFTGTYDTPGVSHVGIYVGEDGDGSPVMLHCGDPIQYSKLDTSYWQSHFYAYGRLNYN